VTSGVVKGIKEIVWVLLVIAVVGAMLWGSYDLINCVFGRKEFLTRGVVLGAFSLLGLFVWLPIIAVLFYGKNDQEATKK